MSFKFNGVEILQPSIHRWLPRNLLGMTGGGQPVYSGVREYELKWQLSSIGDYYQLQQSFNNLSGSTTIVVDLPNFYSTGTYSFYSYTGCILREPEYSEWFNGYYRDATLLIQSIRT
jgi:hypothetical protein